MLRWVSFFLLFALIILCTFTGYIYTYRAEFLSAELSKALDVQVKIKSIGLTKNGLKIKGLRLHNPPDCTAKNALIIDKILLKTDLSEILKIITGINSDKIFIDQIKIDKPEMNIELFSITGSDNNWKRILAKVAAAKKATSSRQFEVKKVILTNVQLEANFHALPKTILKPAPIEKIELKNVGSGHPVDIRAVIHEILKQLTEHSSKQLGLDQMQSAKLDSKTSKVSSKEINEGREMLQALMKKNKKK